MTHRVVLLILVLLAGAAYGGVAVPGPTGAAPADPHAHLDRILQRPMFQQWRAREQLELPGADVNVPQAVTEWVRRCGRAIGDFFDWLFRSRGRGSSSPGVSVSEALPVILEALAWVALGAALVFLAVLLIRLLGDQKTSVPTAKILSRHQVHQAMESGDALAMNTAGWMDEARRLAAEQNFRAVYRALYLALLSGLHTLGKIEHSRNRTNWAYVRQYRGSHDERATFAELTQLFDHVWYGHKSTVEHDIEQLRRQVAALTQAEAAT